MSDASCRQRADGRRPGDVHGQCLHRRPIRDGAFCRGRGDADDDSHHSSGFISSGLVRNTVTAGARATAGMDQVVCEFTPMFICNPYATAGNDLRSGHRCAAGRGGEPGHAPAADRDARAAAAVMGNTAREITASWTIPRLATAPTRCATRSRWPRRPLASGRTASTQSPALSRRCGLPSTCVSTFMKAR